MSHRRCACTKQGRGLQGGIETLKASTSTDRYAVEKVNRCRNELSKTIHPLPPDFASDFAIKIDGTVRHLRQVFFKSNFRTPTHKRYVFRFAHKTLRDTHTLQRLASSTTIHTHARIRACANSYENNQVFDANLLEEDGEDDIAPGSGSPVCTVASSPVAERASGLSQLDPMKLRMENTQLKKQLRRFRVRASFCVCACSNMCVHGLMTHAHTQTCVPLSSLVLVHHHRTKP